MSVCRYYLQGNCRYGEQCRMSHDGPREARGYRQPNPPSRPHHPRPQIDSRYNYVAPSHNTKHSTTGYTVTPKHQNYKYAEVFKWATANFPNKDKALDIMQQLQKEAKVLQKSPHFWRFTSRSLYPNGTKLADWHDHSFEEVHWLYQVLTSENREHEFKKNYFEYITKADRQIVGLAEARIETFEQLKPYIDEFMKSEYLPSKTLSTDIEMRDIDQPLTSNFPSTIQSNNYTPEDQLLEDERAAFESDTFEFGQIPSHAPSQQFC